MCNIPFFSKMFINTLKEILYHLDKILVLAEFKDLLRVFAYVKIFTVGKSL